MLWVWITNVENWTDSLKIALRIATRSRVDKKYSNLFLVKEHFCGKAREGQDFVQK